MKPGPDGASPPLGEAAAAHRASVPPGASPERAGASAYAILAGATLTQIGASFAQQGLAILAFAMGAADHMGLVGTGVLAAAITLGMAVSMLPSGAAADRLGIAGTALVGGLGVAAMLVVVHLVVPGSVPLLIAALAGVGVFTALVPMSGSRAVMLAFPPKVRGVAMGIRQAGVTVGAALAAATLPSLESHWGLKGTLSGMGVPALVFAVCLAGISWWTLRRDAKVTGPSDGARPVSGDLIRAMHGAFPVAVVGGLLSAGQYVALAYLIPFLHASGESIFVAGLVLSLVQVGGTVGRVLFGAISDRRGGERGRVVAWIAVLGCAGLVAVPVSVSLGAPAAVLDGLAVVLGFGIVGWNALCLTWGAERAEKSAQGTAMGMVGAVIFLGATIWPPLFGTVVAAWHSYLSAWGMVAVLYALAAWLAMRLVGARRGRTEDVSAVRDSGSGTLTGEARSRQARAGTGE